MVNSVSLDNEITYSVVDYEGIKIVKLSGSISNATKLDFERLVNSLTQRNNIVLNMSEITVITSSGINSLVNASNEARKRNKRMMIMGMREGLVKMMEVMGVVQNLSFIESIEESVLKI